MELKDCVYILMHKNEEVVPLLLDQDTGRITKAAACGKREYLFLRLPYKGSWRKNGLSVSRMREYWSKEIMRQHINSYYRRDGIMQDLFDNSRQDCIELAKRNIVDCIYSSARIEGIGITFPDTQQIYDGHGVANLSIDDIIKVNNLKRAWQFIFESIDYPLDFLYLSQLNQIINTGLMADAGNIRSYDAAIGGTTWKPEIPDREKITADLEHLMKIECVTERAIKVMLYVMRAQMFSDDHVIIRTKLEKPSKINGLALI